MINQDIILKYLIIFPNTYPDNKIYQKLNKYKNMINEVDNIKIWDFCKKLSNEYELLHHCIK